MKTTVLLALTLLTACDYVARMDFKSERADRVYREAMDDYRAGRMEAAFAGFEKVVKANPANASARFQLACMSQDLKEDYLSAFCGYREFLFQRPESDRAGLASDRLVACERMVAKQLASKYGFDKSDASAAELEVLRAELKTYKDRVAAAEKNLGASQERVRALSDERDRLLAAIKGEDPDGDDLASAPPQKVLKEKDLLDDGDEDETSTGSSLIPVRSSGGLAEAEKKDALVQKKEDVPVREIPEHPKTYVVEDGDTLYGVAKRFYGSIQYWKTIREANKTLISSDNRLRAGDTLVLP